MNKYRAWVKSEKRYIVDTQDFIPLIVTNKGVMKLQPQFEKNYYEILPLDWFVIEQFTGLRDKNGVEIYEGDIVYGTIKGLLGQGYQNGIVKYGEYGFIIDLKKQSWEPGIGMVGFCSFEDYEVIGNIHERKWSK